MFVLKEVIFSFSWYGPLPVFREQPSRCILHAKQTFQFFYKFCWPVFVVSSTRKTKTLSWHILIYQQSIPFFKTVCIFSSFNDEEKNVSHRFSIIWKGLINKIKESYEHFKGILMQIWKSHYWLVFMENQYPGNFAFLQGSTIGVRGVPMYAWFYWFFKVFKFFLLLTILYCLKKAQNIKITDE